jgi:hypothetical protein
LPDVRSQREALPFLLQFTALLEYIHHASDVAQAIRPIAIVLAREQQIIPGANEGRGTMSGCD